MGLKTHYAPSEGAKFQDSEFMVVVSCPTCHIRHAIPESLYRSARKYPGVNSSGWKLFCPLGHEWWYTGKSQDEKMEDLRQQLQEEIDRSGNLVAQLDQSEARRAAQKGATTRARKERDRIIIKIREGVCPVKGCGRTFTNVKNHIHAKHPEFDIPYDHD